MIYLILLDDRDGSLETVREVGERAGEPDEAVVRGARRSSCSSLLRRGGTKESEKRNDEHFCRWVIIEKFDPNEEKKINFLNEIFADNFRVSKQHSKLPPETIFSIQFSNRKCRFVTEP
jgi:hypothetical protein